MPANEHLAPQLDAYIALSEPGFALLVTAPWGAGKTHALKVWLKGHPHLYISLFGLESRAAIEEALFQAALERAGGNETDAYSVNMTKAMDGVMRVMGGALSKAVGASIDLNGAYRKLVLREAPPLVVFDDLERASMKPAQLLSILSDFVEHKGKQVIAIANEAELEKDQEFMGWKEKVIGRTIAIAADPETVLPIFLDKLNAAEGKAQRYLSQQSDLLLRVFNTSGCQNLRLLQQAIREFARLYCELPILIQENEKAMPKLLATFVALSLAYHAAKISREELSQSEHYEGLFSASKKKIKEDDPKKNLKLLVKRYEGLTEVHLDRSVLGAELSTKLIADGYADAEETSASLSCLAMFQNEVEKPWITLWGWRRRPEEDVRCALGFVDQQLADLNIINPFEILHVFGIRLGLSDCGIIAQSRAEIVEAGSDYVRALGVSQKLQTDMPARRWRNMTLGDDSAFGLGYAQVETTEFKNIKSTLIAGLDAAWKLDNPKRLSQLLTYLSSDPNAFCQALDGSGRELGIPDFSRDLIFLDADVAEFAERVFLVEPELWSHLLYSFKDRLARQGAAQSVDGQAPVTERSWLLAFREAARAIARHSSPIRKAQIEHALKWDLGFLDPEVAEEGKP